MGFLSSEFPFPETHMYQKLISYNWLHKLICTYFPVYQLSSLNFHRACSPHLEGSVWHVCRIELPHIISWHVPFPFHARIIVLPVKLKFVNIYFLFVSKVNMLNILNLIIIAFLSEVKLLAKYFFKYFD